MKRIGILGGMSWESTIQYYRGLNEGVRARLGGLHSADLILRSVEFADIRAMMNAGDWEGLGARMAGEAALLEEAGAQLVILSTNTVHRVADQIRGAISVPFLHIAEVTADRMAAAGIKKAGLLATAVTMEEDSFFCRILEERGIAPVLPAPEVRAALDRIIFGELCCGERKECSRQAFQEAARALLDQGAEGLILGCTEIFLLISQKDFTAPVFDTTAIHVDAALNAALDRAL